MIEDSCEVVIHVVEDHVEITLVNHHFQQGDNVLMLQCLEQPHFTDCSNGEL